MFWLNALVVIELLEFAFMMAGEFSQNMSLVSALFMAWNEAMYIDIECNFAYNSTYWLFLFLSASHLSHVCPLAQSIVHRTLVPGMHHRRRETWPKQESPHLFSVMSVFQVIDNNLV